MAYLIWKLMLTQRNKEKIRHALLCNANLFPKENSIALFLCVKKNHLSEQCKNFNAWKQWGMAVH